MGILDSGQPQQQMQQTIPLLPPTMQPITPTEDFFIYRLEGGDILEEIQHQLKGEIAVYNGTTKEYKKLFDPLVNDRGMSVILHTLYSYGINKNVLLGNLEKPEIYTRCRNLWKELAKVFAFSYNKYGVDKENRGLLIKTVLGQVHSALSRSELGRESEQLSTATQKVMHSIHQDKQQQSPLNPARLFSRRER